MCRKSSCWNHIFVLLFIESMYVVFGDSHANCFLTTFPNNVHSFIASSAKGLNNVNSKSGVNKKIVEHLAALPDDTNILFFFGKVDLDFILNYKYNTVDSLDYSEYILSIVHSYIEFVKENTSKKNVYLCELPIPHIDDASMLEILCKEDHSTNINSHLSETDTCTYSTFTKVLPYDERVKLYTVFNKELEAKCTLNAFTFVEINKYFLTETGEFEIPSKYIDSNKLNHHLLPEIVELFLKSLHLP